MLLLKFMGKNGKQLSRTSKSILFVFSIFVILTIISGMLVPGYFTADHIGVLAQQSSALGVVSIGQTLVILTGGFDLSLGSTVLFTFNMLPLFTKGSNSRLPFGMLVCMAFGMLFGLMNGLGITFLKIPPLIMTLALSSFIRGLAYILTKAAAKGTASPVLCFVGQKMIYGIPVSTCVWILITVIFAIILQKTKFGLELYSVGSNVKTAYLGGVRVRKLLISYNSLIYLALYF